MDVPARLEIRDGLAHGGPEDKVLGIRLAKYGQRELFAATLAVGLLCAILALLAKHIGWLSVPPMAVALAIWLWVL